MQSSTFSTSSGALGASGTLLSNINTHYFANGGNTVLGANAGTLSATPVFVTAVGANAGKSLTSSNSYSAYVGYNSATNLIAGVNNATLGDFTLYSTTNANRCVAIGSGA